MDTLERILSIPDTRNEWILFQLRVRGLSFAILAKRQGVSRQCVKSALNKPYPKMERLIAKAIDMPVKQLWPERYGHAIQQETVVNG